ncbi:hypothetical protein ACIQ4I_12475 [Rummeliibacillus sp. NPDC094406]|uniref:hypothetical protein n=1 Tax=Rummeliibacillus sp. NPDC094406 TaxID=3364511 RepID=UPI003802B4EA
MESKELISVINKSVDELDFVTARRHIEENSDLVKHFKVHLNSNAREILNFILDKKNQGAKPLTKSEINTINAINVYASKFDIRGLKLVIKGKESLFLREEVLAYLNTDAKIMLEGMGTIK